MIAGYDQADNLTAWRRSMETQYYGIGLKYAHSHLLPLIDKRYSTIYTLSASHSTFPSCTTYVTRYPQLKRSWAVV